MDLFALSAKLTLDSTGFESGLRSAENSAKRSSSVIGRFTSGITGLAKTGLPKLGSIGLKTFGGITKVAGLSVSVLRKIATTATLATGALAAMGSAAIPMIKKSISAYADFEQLEGGMKKLFGDAYHLVVQNADKAYKTAGISANKYMQLTTTFAAKLVNDLGGNTELAAQAADQAIVDMADNVNTFGTSMEDVQNAYRGFARGNFTMLDNLSLGYAGTKEGMEQLLARAEELSGVHYDIESFSDIIAAIHVIQKDMGVAGTTMEEASNTISGSINMVKASWADLLTDMANPDKDLKKSTQKFTESVKAMITKLKPAILQAMTGLSSVITELAPFIAQELPSLLEEMLPAIFGIGIDIGSALFKAIFTILKPSTIAKTVKNIGKKVRTRLTDLLGLSQDASLSDIAQGVAEKLRNGFQNVGGEAKTLLADLLGLDPEDASWGQIGQEIFRSIVGGLNFGNEFLKRLFIGNDIFDSMTKDLKGQEPSWEAVIQKWAGTLKKEFSKFTLFGDGENSLISLGLDIAGGLTELISQAIGGLANFLTAPETQNAAQEFLSGIALDLSKILSKMIEQLPSLLQSLSGTLESLINNPDMKSAVSGLLSSAAKTLVTALSDKTTWGNLFQSVVDLIRLLGDALYQALIEASSVAVEGEGGVGGLIGAILEIAKQIGSGIWEGLKSIDFGDGTLGQFFDTWRKNLTKLFQFLGFVDENSNFRTPPIIEDLLSLLGLYDKDKHAFKNGIGEDSFFGQLIGLFDKTNITTFIESLQPLLKAFDITDETGTLKLPEWITSFLRGLGFYGLTEEDKKAGITQEHLKTPIWVDTIKGSIDKIADSIKTISDAIDIIVGENGLNLPEGLEWLADASGTNLGNTLNTIATQIGIIVSFVGEFIGSLATGDIGGALEAIGRLYGDTGKNYFGLVKGFAKIFGIDLNPEQLSELERLERGGFLAKGTTSAQTETSGTQQGTTGKTQKQTTYNDFVKNLLAMYNYTPEEFASAVSATDGATYTQNLAKLLGLDMTGNRSRLWNAEGITNGKVYSEFQYYSDLMREAGEKQDMKQFYKAFESMRTLVIGFNELDDHGTGTFTSKDIDAVIDKARGEYDNFNLNTNFDQVIAKITQIGESVGDLTGKEHVINVKFRFLYITPDSLVGDLAQPVIGKILGGGAIPVASHAKGAWDIPYNNYLANLHRDEMVLTASQARDYREGNNDNSAIVDAIRGLRQDITNLQLVVGQKTFGRAVVNYSGKRMNGYIGEAEDKLSAGYGWG